MRNWETLSDGGPNVRKDAVPLPMHRQKHMHCYVMNPYTLGLPLRRRSRPLECQVVQRVGVGAVAPQIMSGEYKKIVNTNCVDMVVAVK